MNAGLNLARGSISPSGLSANQSLPVEARSETEEKNGWRGYSKNGTVRILLLLTVLSVVTGLLYFLHFPVFYTSDSPTYVVPAGNLLDGHGFTNADGRPETFRTPGYPLLILPFLSARLDLKYLVIFQHIVRVLIILASSVFVLRATRSRRQGLIAGILLCIDLPMLEATNAVMTEILFTATLLAVIWLLWNQTAGAENWVRPVTAGLLAGMSVLIRPVSLLLFVPVTPYLLLTNRSFKTRVISAFLLAFSLFPAAWAARNYRETGYFIVSSVSSTNMLLWRAAGTLAIRDPGDFHANLVRRQVELEQQVCTDFRRLGKECVPTTAPPPEQSEYYARLGRKIVMAHPGSYAKLALRGAALMMLDGGPWSLAGITGIAPSAGIRILLIYTVPFLGLALLGLFRLWKENRDLFYLSFLVIGYFVIVSAGAEAYSRLRVPLDPIYTLLAAVGMDTVLVFVVSLTQKLHHSRTA